ncbi:hypothetical protein Tco_0429713 [Tanacetum coccineum]
MSTLTFANTHNIVEFLEKPAESDGFHKIIDFLNANQIHYALTVNPTIYTSCIEQFWATTKAKTVNGERQLQALVDKKKVIITETTNHGVTTYTLARASLDGNCRNGPDWLFDVDSLTISMNYEPVVAGNQTNVIAGTRDNIVTGHAEKKTEPKQEYILIPICTTDPLIS